MPKILIASLAVTLFAANALAAEGGPPRKHPLRSCDDVARYCANHCARTSPPTKAACDRACPRRIAEESGLQCVSQVPEPQYGRCEQVEAACADACGNMPDLLKNECMRVCPLGESQGSGLTCNWPPDGIAHGKVYGPGPAKGCEEVVTACRAACATQGPVEGPQCVRPCAMSYARRSGLTCR